MRYFVDPPPEMEDNFVFPFGVWVSKEKGSEEEVKEERGFYLSVFGLGERAEAEDLNAGSGSRA